MKVIGVHFGHESGACLVEDGEIKRHVTEERYVGIKNAICTPYQSLKYCLNGLDIKDVNIAVSDSIISSLKWNYNALLHKKEYSHGIPVYLEKDSYNIEEEQLVEHHLCHAASTYYTSGMDDTLIITADAVGTSTTQWVGWGKKGKIKELYRIDIVGIYSEGICKRVFKDNNRFMSWGFFYGAATEALGWIMNEGEGKVMGLAPYGDPNAIPEKIIRELMYKVETLSYVPNLGKTLHHVGLSNKMVKLIDIYGRENFAAAVQRAFENRIIRFLKYWIKKTGAKRLCTAGGCFLNVKLNQRIHNECDVEYFPFPIASDGGQSIGAALYEYHKYNDYTPKRIDNLYWGEEYSNEYMKRLLDISKLKYIPYETEYVAERLYNGKIVGWFDGRMESGPRALGHRSILMSPLKAGNKDYINSCVKFREGFRPFCPSVTEESYSKYFSGRGGDYMITSAVVTTPVVIPAVTHVDNTARPHMVKKSVNPKFYNLLYEFGQISGHPVLLNTSFNIQGQPIIRTPEDAIRCFYATGMDILVLQDYLVSK